MALRVILQQPEHRVRDRTGIVEWDNHASLLCQQFLRMPIRRGDDGFSSAQRDGECAGDDLRLLPVGRDVNVRRAHVLDQLLRTHKAVVQDQLRRHAKFLSQCLQLIAISLSLTPANVRMRNSRDDVHHIRMLRKDCGQRADHILDAFVGRQQAEGQQYGFSFRAEAVLEVVGVHEVHLRHSMRNNIDLLARNCVHVAQQLGSQLAHHHHTVRERRNLFEHRPLVRIRLAQNRVARCHQGHLQFAEKRQDVAACGAAVDAVFMLQAHKIVAVEIQEVGGTLIGGHVFLLKFQTYLFGVVVMRIRIVDRDCKQPLWTILGPESRAKVRGESRNAALARKIVPDKGNACRQRNWRSVHFNRGQRQ